MHLVIFVKTAINHLFLCCESVLGLSLRIGIKEVCVVSPVIDVAFLESNSAHRALKDPLLVVVMLRMFDLLELLGLSKEAKTVRGPFFDCKILCRHLYEILPKLSVSGAEEFDVLFLTQLCVD